MHAANFCCRSLIRMAIVSSRIAQLHPRKSIYTSLHVCVYWCASAHIEIVCETHTHTHTVALASWTHLLAFDMAYLRAYLCCESLSLSFFIFSLCRLSAHALTVAIVNVCFVNGYAKLFVVITAP